MTLRETRKYINCNLRDFANYLLITKSTLNNIENGTARLQPKSQKYFDELHQLLVAGKPKRNLRKIYLDEESEELKAYQKTLQEENKFKIMDLERKLAKMEMDYSKELELLDRLSLLEAVQAGRVGKQHANWIDILVYDQKEKIKTVGLIEQDKLRRRLAVLKG